ncbi:arsenate reductase family protein [Wenxinia saemankumensis]|uniref:Arsenate reductase n=1 Tax=Wenxinia saemankumensis TaxID=1447782 RepID=A0A1M6D546_9RHOB|nr:arsenate reductase family protein [Wenxinia saemankumensis]SHI68233.1 arsenate reductase [Wenxinia saemankumensis]
MSAVIFHNPDCGTSRNVLALLEATGHAPQVIPYLETGWTRPLLLTLLAAADLTPREALRVSRSPAEELGLTAEGASDDEILDAMLTHPILVNRPFVATARGVALCRPSEAVIPLLDAVPTERVLKEDGTILYDPALHDPAGTGGA